MQIEELEKNTQEVVNAIGLKCPMPVIKLQQAVRKYQKDEIVAIDFDDAGGQKDIASWARVNKHHIESTVENDNAYRIYLRCFANKV